MAHVPLGEGIVNYSLLKFADAAEYRARVGSFLMAAEARHNLLLGVITSIEEGSGNYQDPILLGAVAGPDGVEGCVWRTPPYKLGLTMMPVEAIPAIVDAVAEVYPELPVVVGPVGLVDEFGSVWSRRTGASRRNGLHQGVFHLDAVTPPSKSTPGVMRVATESDLALLMEWSHAFVRDSHLVGADPDNLTRRLVAKRRMFLWEDERPRCMAAALASTPNGVRVGYVYTPEEMRGRGFASTLVAALSQAMLEEGHTFCFLYADLSNTTSTGIYRKLGYRLVEEARDILFTYA